MNLIRTEQIKVPKDFNGIVDVGLHPISYNPLTDNSRSNN